MSNARILLAVHQAVTLYVATLISCNVPNIRDRLTREEIKAELDRWSIEAKKCGQTFEATSGSVVNVRLRISGETGMVLNVEVQPPFNEMPLGACVQEAMSLAVFRRIRSESTGVSYCIHL